MVMYTTPWKTIRGGKERIRATYGMDEEFARRNNQAPHISVTGEIEEKRGGRWVDSAGSQLHTEIAKHFPKLRDLIAWHLVAEPGVPMHYLANGQYWWEFVTGTSKWGTPSTDPEAAFKSTILYGMLPSDKELQFTDKGPTLNGKKALKDIRPWLEKRLPGLQKKFSTVVKKYKLNGSGRKSNSGAGVTESELTKRLKF